MTCKVCQEEYNVSPFFELRGPYVCPRCCHRSRMVYGG